MACVFCKAAIFQEWVASQTGGSQSEAAAKEFILEKCEVDSRTKLDAPEVALRFHKLIRKPYLQWKEPA